MPFASTSTVRTVAGPAPAVRSALARALREQHFEITAEQVSLLEARRGSALGTAALQRQRLPVVVALHLQGDEKVVRIDIELRDALPPSAGLLGLQRSYD